MDNFITVNSHKTQLKGYITFDTLYEYWKEINRILAQGGITHLDFSSVEACDTSAVSLLLHLKRSHPDVQFENLPLKLTKLISLSNCQSLFTAP